MSNYWEGESDNHRRNANYDFIRAIIFYKRAFNICSGDFSAGSGGSSSVSGELSAVSGGLSAVSGGFPSM